MRKVRAQELRQGAAGTGVGAGQQETLGQIYDVKKSANKLADVPETRKKELT